MMEFVSHYKTSSGIDFWLPSNIMEQIKSYYDTNLIDKNMSNSKRSRNARAACSMHPDDR